jgi:thiol-disulfide isomerase/thioredoxin
MFFDFVKYFLSASALRIRNFFSCLYELAPIWLTNYDDAIAESASLDRIILADFTGSDWCPHCMDLKREVFDSVEFKCWAKRKVILLELDFPMNIPQPPELSEQNNTLKEQYGVDAYPTVIGLDADGTELGRLVGYTSGTGPIMWISSFEDAVGLNYSSPL